MPSPTLPERIDLRRRLVCGGAIAFAVSPLAGCEIGGAISASAQETAMPSAADLPDEGRLASFRGATGWLNSPPLTPEGLKGKVVLVDFWTFTCVNWIRTAPYVRAWAEKYKEHGLVVIGVHTPEFSFEHDVDNVTRAARAMRVDYPVALDPNYAVWSDFDNHYWPAVYLADANGRIRAHQFGEGDYDRTERAIQALLVDAGHDGFARGLVEVDAIGPDRAVLQGLRAIIAPAGEGKTESAHGVVCSNAFEMMVCGSTAAPERPDSRIAAQQATVSRPHRPPWTGGALSRTALASSSITAARGAAGGSTASQSVPSSPWISIPVGRIFRSARSQLAMIKPKCS